MGNPEKVNYVYSDEIKRVLSSKAMLDTSVVCDIAAIEKNPEAFKDTKYIFSTWGMPHFEQSQIRKLLPSLEAVFYAAGSVQSFAKEFIECGVKVFSAWAANAVPVAEYTVAQIILAGKGFYKLSAMSKKGLEQRKQAAGLMHFYRGNYGASVGIIGAGMIGRMVIERLKEYKLCVKVYDPFLSDEQAKTLGVEKCSLEELFAGCEVISNHVANNPRTVGMINGKLLSMMKPYSTFINTGRGAQVVESDLFEVLAERKDITAVLDVTLPEPPENGSPMYTLENIVLTPHIAGSMSDEVVRMAGYMLDEFEAYTAGKETRYEVTLKMLETMA